ncbi:hypothetical protein [Mesobacillus selenatarsenatis]|uniref:Uncharacterized protein n=1 Tax=Mesobacillus selenatarsenatis (strain DSM 18680 / JCM 14380 / FERM P-15431 / SF-1) TaxID=1321606 RepID=A0A0A8X7J6_MESS1|nr:hypothetical protein [Mesobacillus selenatarsenatis]GAM14141.1 hypothetical protein SAMD00020551_2289 [Mesobacillus selenatarsenatis SF-1]
MFLDAYVNQKVQIKLKNFPESMIGDITGIYQPDEWYLVKIVHAENMGIWVENPCYKRTPVQKEDGTAIPAEDQVEETCITHMFLRWDYIASVITFPDSDPKADKKAKLIGFQPDVD